MDDSAHLSRLTLMCRDHEVLDFTWNHQAQSVTGKTEQHESRYAPLMACNLKGHITKDRLTAWFKNRCIPDFRPSAQDKLNALGYTSAASLMASGFGASLSDQYWVRPQGSKATWGSISCFTNDFSEELGELLLPHDDSSVPSLVKRIKSDLDVLASSPDAALNGNLPKRWRIDDGKRILVKSGKQAHRMQEPFNEVAASALCARILDSGEFVTYSLEDGGFMKWTSLCETMVDDRTEFVPAYALITSGKRRGDQSLFDFYIETCARHGLDVRQSVEKMLVVDFLTANFDRHWNNFGVLLDAETRSWIGAAPIFDTGESYWCDRDTSCPFNGYRTDRPNMMRPFARDVDSQLERFCTDMTWFDADKLKGYSEEACTILSGNPFVSNDPGRLDKIKAALDGRVAAVAKHAAAVRPRRGCGRV